MEPGTRLTVPSATGPRPPILDMPRHQFAECVVTRAAVRRRERRSGHETESTRSRSRPLRAVAGKCAAQDKNPVSTQITSHVVKPKKLDLTQDALGELQVPSGFTIEKFAEGLVNPRVIAVTEDEQSMSRGALSATW